ncbi:MAG TPA: hypothetical protein VK831_00660 [Candidatus Deferrimicrobiaceae bacterium]|nr:hypothetical protein [Candidatus Deferrimicrobiaceae bacterium]
MTAPRAASPPPEVDLAGLALVPRRSLLSPSSDAWFPLAPGDRPRVEPEQVVAAGDVLADRLREPRTLVLPRSAARDSAQPGEHWSARAGRRPRGGEPRPEGELLFRSGARWRVAAGERFEALEAPFAGVVQDVRPGIGIRVTSDTRAIAGADVLAGPTAGRLQIVASADGELRAQHVDVGTAGAIIVAGARMDAEALARARAVGIRGVIVAGLGIKERRDFLASERRGRAAVHGLPRFGILVLEGAARRPISAAHMALFEALEGRPAAIVGRPPCLVVDDGGLDLPLPPVDAVRVRSGPLVGAEGRWVGLAGPRRFPAGVTVESAFVRFGDRAPIAVPIGDLERFTEAGSA